MSDPKEQPRDVTEDLELEAEDAAKAVGGDTKPTSTTKPQEYYVVGMNDIFITGPTTAP
jgi:hypothetical protein